MRVAVWHNLPSGGGKRALYDQVRGLVACGHHVEAYCPPTANREYLPLSEVVAEHITPMPAVASLWSRARRRLVPAASEPALAAMTTHARAFADEIRGRFDVVLAAPCQLLGVPLVGLACEEPSVLYLQEPNRVLYEASFRPDLARPHDQPTLPWLGPKRTARRAAVLGRAESRAIRAFDRLLVNSYFTRESVLRAFGVPSRVCYLGVDTARFAPTSGERGDHVVGVGAFVPEKRIELALQALAELGEARPLVWIGNHVYSDEYMIRLARLATDLGVDFRPQVLIADEDLVRAVSSAAAMVYAPRLEPFGYAPLEANACGVAVAAGAEGGVRETVVDGVNGLLVEPRAGELAGAIERLVGDTVFARDIRERARAHVAAQWNVAAAVDRLEGHLRAAVGRRC